MSERRYYLGPDGELVRADFDAEGVLIEVTEYTVGPGYEVSEEEPEVEPEEKREEFVPPPAPKPKKESKNTTEKYDVVAMERDILNGMKVPAIAEKYGVIAVTVYKRKKKMISAGEWAPEGCKTKSTLTKDEIEEIQQRRADGETTSEIAAVMELDSEAVALVKADGRHGKGDRKPASIETQEEKIQKMVAQGCGVGEVMMAFPYLSEKQAQEAVAWAMHVM